MRLLSIVPHPFILPIFLSNAMCVLLSESPGTHMYNACHPLPARNLACSDIGNEQQTAARSSARTLRCWWHKNGQLKRKTKIQSADLERNFDWKACSESKHKPHLQFYGSAFWFVVRLQRHKYAQSNITRRFSEMMTYVLTLLPDNTSENCYALSHEQKS